MTYMSALWLALVVVGLYCVLRVQRRAPVLQYLFFSRFQILVALALVGLPPVAFWGAPRLLNNLFILGRAWEVAVVAWLAVVASWVLMFTTLLLLYSASRRFGVRALAPPGWLMRFRSFLFAALAVPVIAGVVARSEIPPGRSLAAAACGIGVAWGLRHLAILLSSWLKPWTSRLLGPLLDPLRKPVEKLVRVLPDNVTRGYDSRHHHFTHERAFGFMLVTLGVYSLGAWVLRPDHPWVATVQIPALAYVLFMILMAGWLLPGVSFYLDRYRVPALLALAGIASLSYTVANTDHFYVVSPRPAAVEEELSPVTAFEHWHRRHPVEAYPVMVVVAASGGGIAASLWVSDVLTHLQRELGDSFAESIVLVSAVSGGSVGTLYYLDAFRRGGPPAEAHLEAIVEGAGSPSLAATAWGVLYPDFWRSFFSLPLHLGRTLDRGWAMEQTWRRHMRHPRRTLTDWRRGMAEGWRPAVIFNSTVVESGERLLLTPLDLPVEEGFEAQSFLRLYPRHDLPVSTAARLSATFPYISPIARPLDGETDEAVHPGYHAADGGYYDNFGVVSTLEWMRRVLPRAGELGRRRVLLVQLWDSIPYGAPPPPQEGVGWTYELVGPLVTLVNVRNSTQELRGQLEIDLLRQAFGDFEIETVMFAIGEDGPLSWQLSDREKEQIRASWTTDLNRQSLAAARAFLEH